MANTLTVKGEQTLQEELTHLLGVERPKVLAMLEDSASNGDVADLADAALLRDQLARIDSRVKEIRRVLGTHVIKDVDDLDVADGVVRNVVVAISFDALDGETERYIIASVPGVVDDVVAISDDSPLAKALLGAHVGDEVAYAGPGGMLRVWVQSIG